MKKGCQRQFPQKGRHRKESGPAAICGGACWETAFSGGLIGRGSIFCRLARFGGAGTLVPITGFANAVVSPALDFKAEGFVTGMAAKMFTVAGPVITFGTLASVVYGIVLMLAG